MKIELYKESTEDIISSNIIKKKEVGEFKIGHHYDFEIKEDRDNYTIVNSIGKPLDRYTSQKIYQKPGDKVKLFVKSFKDNGEPFLTFSILNSYTLHDNYLFDATMTSNQNGYLLEDNEYHEHFIPLSFKSLIDKGTIKLKVSAFDEINNKLIFENPEFKEYNSHQTTASSHSSFINDKDYKFEVLGFKKDFNGEENLIKLSYKGEEYTTKAVGFQKEYGIPKWMYCTVNTEPYLRLYQNFILSYQEEFTPGKLYFFKIIDQKIDQNNAPFYLLKDKQVGFIHRIYKNKNTLGLDFKIGDFIELYVVEINKESKHLKLDWNVKNSIENQRKFYSPDKVFSEIDNYSINEHLYNLQDFTDKELENIGENYFKPSYLNLFSQIENENNNWFFSYLSLLLQYNDSLIEQGDYQKAKDYIQLYKTLEEWLLCSDFIDEYSKHKKQDIIDNAEKSLDEQEYLLIIIDDLEGKKHYKKLDSIFLKLQKHGVISKGDLKKTIEYLKRDKSLLSSHYNLMYGIIHELLDNNKIVVEDLKFLNYITNQAYECTFSSRNFVLSSDGQELRDLEKEELHIENKHLFMQIRLNEALGWHYFSVLKSAELLRNFAILSSDSSLKKKYLLQSIDVLIKEISLVGITINDFLNLSKFSVKLDVIIANKNTSENVNKLFYYESSGVLINSENGWLISNQFTSFNNNLKSNDSYSVLLSLYDSRIEVITNSNLKEHYKVLDSSSENFWGTYINNRKILNDKFEEVTPKLKKRQHYIRNILKSIDYLISFEDDLNKKIETLQTAKLITVVLKDHKSYYYGEILKLYYRINNLKNNIYNNDLSYTIDNKTLRDFPVLNKIEKLHLLINLIGADNNTKLNLFSDTDKNNIALDLFSGTGNTSLDLFSNIGNTTVLDSFLKSEYSSIRSISKKIIAYNNIKIEFPDEVEIHNKLMSLIKISFLNKALFIESSSIEPDNEIETPSVDNQISSKSYFKTKEFKINDGREDILTEFKTSIVYHPGSNEPEINKQASQIVKVITGFLNSRGGKLYLGVKDNGTIIGLNTDYKQLNVNSDSYERLIRKHIIKHTNNTVNGLLDFEYINNGLKEYLIIHIPISDILVDFKEDFHQRQGTETRLIKGQDLTILFQNRINKKVITSKRLEQVEVGILSEKSTIYDKNKVDPVDKIKQNQGLYKISIFEDRSWIWSDVNTDFDASSLSFTICDQYSYILICYSEGRLAKFRTKSFLLRNKNERQYNTFALRSDSKIVNIFEIKKDVNLLVKSILYKEVYLKIINSSEAGAVRNSLTSQGTYFIDSNIDTVLSIKPINLENLKCCYHKLQTSKQNRGIALSSDKIKELVKELKENKYL
ncbi:AlbA family DNA-binding domain-containing protein [Tenacibaculum finnmarkense]|uniref:AlbA family DNA-binding domain-containing protein n=1 Tax=Tenacibaculum finnmarkense TaxID=2781243 RepID=UPI00187B22E4|nr:ATP-binding protein [Tenacibaculum finnmarkense]MBE7646299.1 hypothetical protein [Tenacibaculum finnmarkense genomovar ulcerans]MBE7688737.1 hypothetical protein [Tenacibaculum finnmarkense genomovar ulcerans]MCG8236679.1 ATP-binding protein [Tenacibaculum finnmarkense genomovar ulcerans]MCG8830922.1 ATP-binding protein [Tenacibaculum finnmarkense]